MKTCRCTMILGLLPFCLAWNAMSNDRLLHALPYWPQSFDVSDLVIASIPAPVPRTGQTTSYGPGDDGDLQPGAAWPEPRFSDNGDGTVSDHLTGLLWTKNSQCTGAVNIWSQAVIAAGNVQDGGCGLTDGSQLGDWHLPTINELASLIHFGQQFPALPNTMGTGQGTNSDPFLNVDQGWPYWTSTADSRSLVYPFCILMAVGKQSTLTNNLPKEVWAVRPDPMADLPIVPAPVPKTGKQSSDWPGDDGDLQPGIPWPSPRFMINANGTVTDNLTHLVWLRDAGCSGVLTWLDALDFAQSVTSGQCGLTDGSAVGQWRLPTIAELRSLAHHEYGFGNTEGDGPFVDGSPFIDVGGRYWSSTTYAPDTNQAFTLILGSQFMDENPKSDDWLEALLVRGGL